MNDSRSAQSGVYMIRCISNGKVYIGSTSNLALRKRSHWNKLKTGKNRSPHLQNTWNKYGEDSFEWHVMEVVELKGMTIEEMREKLIEREQHHIDTHDSVRKGMNARPYAGSNLGRANSPETRAKISATHMARGIRPRHSAEIKAKITATRQAKTKSQQNEAPRPGTMRTKYGIRKVSDWVDRILWDIDGSDY